MMTRQDAEALLTDLLRYPGIVEYAKNIPGFWDAWRAGNLGIAVQAARTWIDKMGDPSILHAQPALASLLKEKVDAFVNGLRQYGMEL